MKNLITSIAILVTLSFCNSCNTDQTNENNACTESLFYYTGNGDKEYPQLQFDFLLLGFKQGITKGQISRFIKSKSYFDDDFEIMIYKTGGFKYQLVPVKMYTSYACIELQDIRDRLIKNDNIEMTGFMFKGGISIGIDEKSNVFSPGESILLSLKQGTTRAQFAEELTKHNLELVKETDSFSEIAPVVYEQNDVLNLSNLLFETGLFEYCEPNFIYFKVDEQ